MRLLKLSYLLSIAFFDFLHLLGNCLLDSPLELWIATLFLEIRLSIVARIGDNLVLMLELLLDAQEASIDLLRQVFNRLVRVDAQQAGLLLMLSLHHEQILIAERVTSQLELEVRLVLVDVVDRLDELLSALGRSQIALGTRCTNVGEAV